MFYPIDKANFYSIIHLYEFKEFLEYARKEKSVTCFRDLVYHSWSAVASGKFDFGYYSHLVLKKHSKHSKIFGTSLNKSVTFFFKTAQACSMGFKSGE